MTESNCSCLHDCTTLKSCRIAAQFFLRRWLPCPRHRKETWLKNEKKKKANPNQVHYSELNLTVNGNKFCSPDLCWPPYAALRKAKLRGSLHIKVAASSRLGVRLLGAEKGNIFFFRPTEEPVRFMNAGGGAEGGLYYWPANLGSFFLKDNGAVECLSFLLADDK